MSNKIGIFFGSWYTAPIIRRVLGHSDSGALQQAMRLQGEQIGIARSRADQINGAARSGLLGKLPR